MISEKSTQNHVKLIWQGKYNHEDGDMSEQKPPENDMSHEFRTLGRNLVTALRTAWESPEREKLQSEIEHGLAEFASAVKNEGKNLRDSSIGKQVKDDLEELRQRLQSDKTKEKVREEILQSLKTINQELEKVITRFNAGTSSSNDSDEKK